MAAADTYLRDYYIDRSKDVVGPHLAIVKANIADSAGSNNKLSESGDKLYVLKLPKFCRPALIWFWQKGLDTNATATGAYKLVFHDGTTAHIMIAAGTVPNSGAEEYRAGQIEPIGDLFDGDGDVSVYIEATAVQATAGTAAPEIAVGVLYNVEYAGQDPA